MIRIDNDGQHIVSTDYWQTSHAARGLCYLSGNAGALRLLIPRPAEDLLPEMRTGKRVRIERSVQLTGHVDIVFDDGSASPFAVAVDPRQIDRALEPRADSVLLLYTEGGLQLRLPCDIRAI